MGGRLNIERILRWTRGRTPVQPDAAEVGTAFGMELSLQPEIDDTDIDAAEAAAEPNPGDTPKGRRRGPP